MPRPWLLTWAKQISIAVESPFHVPVRLPAIGSGASTARSPDLHLVARGCPVNPRVATTFWPLTFAPAVGRR